MSRPPNKHALSIIADGMNEAIRTRDWSEVARYQNSIKRLSMGLSAFGLTDDEFEELRRERLEDLLRREDPTAETVTAQRHENEPNRNGDAR